MSLLGKWINRKKIQATRSSPDSCPTIQDDSITLDLPMLSITLSRQLNIDVPHEVSVIVPRAEIRCSGEAMEIIYSSITVIHAPRHPLAGEQPPATVAIPQAAGNQPAAVTLSLEGGEESLHYPGPVGKSPLVNFKFK
ncbi:MAG: hypothetical protein ACYDEQ_04540 [Desulfocucumaceae bacterium]